MLSGSNEIAGCVEGVSRAAESSVRSGSNCEASYVGRTSISTWVDVVHCVAELGRDRVTGAAAKGAYLVPPERVADDLALMSLGCCCVSCDGTELRGY